MGGEWLRNDPEDIRISWELAVLFRGTQFTAHTHTQKKSHLMIILKKEEDDVTLRD